MKRIILAISLITMMLTSTTVYAKNYKFVFWYPGEAGSTAEAQPILDTFAEYLNSKISGSKFSGKYFNSTSKGLVYIKGSKPAFGILSWIAYSENKSTLPAHSIIANTKPFPDGRTVDQFVIVGIKDSDNVAWQPEPDLAIYSSIPVTLSFVKNTLMPDFQGTYNIQTTRSLMMKLKQIANDNDTKSAALLTPMEFYTLSKLQSPWTEKFQVIYKCKPIPTAPVVYFGKSDATAMKFLKVLSDMGSDPEGREILEALRLKGIKPIN